MAFQDELRLIRQQAMDKYGKRKTKSKENNNTTGDEIICDEDLLRYSTKRESISDQIKCNHSVNTKCINCISRRLLPFDQKQLSLKYGLFNRIFTNQNNAANIQKLIKISRASQPNSLQQFQPQKSLQYGEILFFSFAHILLKIQFLSSTAQHAFSYADTIFIDFGSGIAKTLFIAALLYKFKQCIGIEIIQKIHQKAVQFKDKIQNKHHRLFQCAPKNIHLIHGNIFDQSMLRKHCFSNQQINDSNYIILIASTAFTHKMMQTLSDTLLSSLKSTRENNQIWIITLSHPLPDKKAFRVVHEDLFRMSWGNVMVYFQYLLNY